MTPTRAVLLYDRDCRFCRFAARIILRLDRHGRLAFLPLQDRESEPLLVGVPAAEREASIRLAEPDGRLFAAGEALAEVITQLGAPAPLRLLGRGYGLVARRRSVLGPLVPDGPAPRRYP
jgi:predicted DCC family thiol-disulfide oxidoreductase YuxK